MKNSEVIHQRLALIAVLSSIQLCLCGFLQPVSAGISEAIAPLEKPELESAKLAVSALEKISKEPNNPDHKSAAVLGAEIKTVFTSEFNLRSAAAKLDSCFSKARDFDKKGMESMQPNALGSINEIRANEMFESATKVRQAGITEFDTAANSLDTALIAFRTASTANSQGANDLSTLSNAAKAIESRSLVPARSTLDIRRRLLTQIPTQIKAELVAMDFQKQKTKENADLISKMRRVQRAAEKAKDYEAAMQIQQRIDRVGAFSKYLGNTESKEIHDLSKETKNCHSDKIQNAGHAIYFTSLEAARAAGYDNCAFCIGDSKR